MVAYWWTLLNGTGGDFNIQMEIVTEPLRIAFVPIWESIGVTQCPRSHSQVYWECKYMFLALYPVYIRNRPLETCTYSTHSCSSYSITSLLHFLHWLPVAAHIRYDTDACLEPNLMALITTYSAPCFLWASSPAWLDPPSLNSKVKVHQSHSPRPSPKG